MDGILLINKPAGMTSHDVVMRLRKLLHTKQIGHTGTLDPNAKGVLMVLIGKATKLLPFLVTDTKIYQASLRLGIQSDTGDVWGNTIKESTVPTLTKEEVEQVLKQFLGKQEQIPPMYSSIKVGGKKLYEYAREGVTIEREPRQIEIFSIELLDLTPDISFKVHCSSGTYVRTLCEDIAIQLKTVGAMSDLVRLQVGEYSIEQSFTLEEVEAGEYSLLAAYQVLKSYPYVETSQVADIKNGKKITLDTEQDQVVLVSNQEVLAIYKREQDSIFSCVRGLW